MSSGTRPRQPSLVVVADNAAASEGAGPARGGRFRAPAAARDVDWSILMARAQGGDRDAYLRLLEEIVPYVRALAARHHRDPRDAEDTVQDALLTMHAIRRTYDPTRPFTPWLAAIVHRRAIDRLRQQGRARARDAALMAESETFAEPPANSAETSSSVRALHQAVASLPPGQRRAVTLLKLQEMSLKQAAEASGTSIAALKVAVHRALRNLRRMLGGGGVT